MHPQNDFNLQVRDFFNILNVHVLVTLFIQVIFHTLPALTGVMEEELIPFQSFVSSSGIWSQPSLPFPITCTNAAIIDALASLLGNSSTDKDSEIIDRHNTQQKVSYVTYMYIIYSSVPGMHIHTCRTRSFVIALKISKKSNFNRNQLKIDTQYKNMYVYQEKL